jgi:hypothetical protein
METQKYEQLKGPYYIVPKTQNWEEDLWYYEVSYPKHLLKKIKSDYERIRETK